MCIRDRHLDRATDGFSINTFLLLNFLYWKPISFNTFASDGSEPVNNPASWREGNSFPRVGTSFLLYISWMWRRIRDWLKSSSPVTWHFLFFLFFGVWRTSPSSWVSRQKIKTFLTFIAMCCFVISKEGECLLKPTCTQQQPGKHWSKWHDSFPCWIKQVFHIPSNR